MLLESDDHRWTYVANLILVNGTKEHLTLQRVIYVEWLAALTGFDAVFPILIRG